MTTVPHSVSEYEQHLELHEWRLVLLFRNVWEQNVKQAATQYDKERERST